MTGTLRVLKGHGTENDFVVIPDLDAVVSLSPSLVQALCDRHGGVGGDGVLRVVRTAQATEPDIAAQAVDAEFFMDYHNADGSISEMCGNGVRVFARYLQRAGLAELPEHGTGPAADGYAIATRGGIKRVHVKGRDISVDLGPSRLRSESPVVTMDDPPWGRTDRPGTAVDMPNPHVVVELDDLSQLAALDLATPPRVTPPLPDGQNVEFVVRTGPSSITMRVHERGVGETRSCGTGICAAVVAVSGGAQTGSWTVDVPGGQCSVSWTEAGSLVLTGPAVLVAEIGVTEEWLAEHR